MKNTHLKSTYPAMLVSLMLLAGACAPLISIFDETAYKNDIDLKVEFQFLIDKAGTPYARNEDQIRDYLKKLHKAYEYEKGRDKNNLTIQQYEILVSSDGPVLGFLKVWKENGVLSNYFITQAKEQSEKIFNEVVKLEQAKRREGIKLKLTSPDEPQTKK